MGSSSYRRLDGVIDEATLREAAVDPETRTARIRLGVLLHTTNPDDPQPERTLVLRDVTRVVAWLRRVRQDPPADGPPVLLKDADGLAGWLRRWSGCDLYDQPKEIFDAGIEPAWLPQPSIDLTWPGEPEQHTMDLALAERRGPGGHRYRLDVRFGFSSLDILDTDGAPDDPDAVADAVAAWWHDMHEGRTSGQYGIYPAGA